MIDTFKRIVGLLLLPLALFLLCSFVAPGFGMNSVGVVLSQTIIPTVMGYGLAFAMTAGIFDLSAGARVILSASVGAVLAATYGLGIPGMILGSIAVGVIAAVVMAISHNLLRIPSLILSLGFVMLIEVIAAKLLGHSSFINIPTTISYIGKEPYKYWICFALAIAFYFLYYRTKFSSHVKVIGENELLARNMGISASRTNFLAYLIGGAFLGVAGILQICYAGSIASSVDMSSLSLVFQPMMGVMIGMELLAIFHNLAVTIVVGELCISIIYNAIIGMGVSNTMQNVVLGVFMIIVMSISANKQEIVIQKRRLKEWLAKSY